MIEYEITSIVQLLNIGKVTCTTIIIWARLNKFSRFSIYLTLWATHYVRVFVWLLEIISLCEAVSLLTAFEYFVLEITVWVKAEKHPYVFLDTFLWGGLLWLDKSRLLLPHGRSERIEHAAVLGWHLVLGSMLLFEVDFTLLLLHDL